MPEGPPAALPRTHVFQSTIANTLLPSILLLDIFPGGIFNPCLLLVCHKGMCTKELGWGGRAQDCHLTVNGVMMPIC